jgi:uncharacterized membrane protein YkoI
MKTKIAVLGLVSVLTIAGSIAAFASTGSGIPVKKQAVIATTEVTKSVDKELDSEKENDSKDEKSDALLKNFTPAISEQQVLDIVKTTYTDGVIGKVELEDEDGTIVYGVEVTRNNQKMDVKIDATTGELIKSEIDQENEDQKNEDQYSAQSNEKDGNEQEDQDQVDEEHED